MDDTADQPPTPPEEPEWTPTAHPDPGKTRRSCSQGHWRGRLWRWGHDQRRSGPGPQSDSSSASSCSSSDSSCSQGLPSTEGTSSPKVTQVRQTSSGTSTSRCSPRPSSGTYQAAPLGAAGSSVVRSSSPTVSVTGASPPEV